MLLRAAYLTALLSSVASAQIIPSLSFGNTQPLSANGQQIPGWRIAAEGPAPPILSDRMTLTPPAPGNIRAGLFTEGRLPGNSFKLDFGFRASGPERGSGNLQIWFVRDPAPAAGLRSVYTADRFQGLVLAIDQYGGSGGSIRGFLNDGSVDYKNHHNVDSLSFGHCSYAFRNLGRWSDLHVQQDAAGFEVSIDGRSCFRSNIIAFPNNYHFGVTAASADTPDSFEINKFVVSSATPAPPSEQPRQDASSPHQQQQQQQQYMGNSMPSGGSGDIQELKREMDAMLQAIAASNRDIKDELERQGAELRSAVNTLQQLAGTQLPGLDRRAQGVESTVLRIQRDLEGRDYKDTLTGLQKALKDTQDDLMSSLPQSMSQIVTTSAPRMWFFIGVIVFTQALLAGGYLLYKRRVANSPKKLL